MNKEQKHFSMEVSNQSNFISIVSNITTEQHNNLTLTRVYVWMIIYLIYSLLLFNSTIF